MPTLNDWIARLQGHLDELDELADALGDEALEDLNAELEDMLLALSDVRPGRPGWQRELEEALDDLDAVIDDYDRMAAGDRPEVAGPAARLRATAAALRDDL